MDKIDHALSFADQVSRDHRQLTLLRDHLGWMQKNSPWYRELFRKLGIEATDVRSVNDLSHLPLTGKDDLAAHNRQFLAVDLEDVVDICQTSGTTGAPVTVWQTENDLQRLACNESLALTTAGIDCDDRVLIGAALDRGFMAGLAYFLGLRRIGATSLRLGSGQPALVAEAIRTHRPNVLLGVPSLLLALARKMSSQGLEPASLGVEKLICIGEPVRSQDLSLAPLGIALQESWGARVLGTYASTEMATSFADCVSGCGGHLLPELVVVEIVDDSGSPVPNGEPGEVVATPLGIEGTPLLRYRTGDIASLHTTPCACGRLTPRLGPILGRRAQMLKVRGVTLFPAAIGHVLQELAGIEGYYIEVEQDFDLSDRVRVVAGCTRSEMTADWVAAEIAGKVRVRPEVMLVSPEEILTRTVNPERRKPQTFFDYRHCQGEKNRSL